MWEVRWRANTKNKPQLEFIKKFDFKVSKMHSLSPINMTMKFHSSRWAFISALLAIVIFASVDVACGATLPVVTSGRILGTEGKALSANITATHSPTGYVVASGTLPTGLSLNATTGNFTDADSQGRPRKVKYQPITIKPNSDSETLVYGLFTMPRAAVKNPDFYVGSSVTGF